MPTWAYFAILVALILSSGFFSASETALMRLGRYRLRHLVRHGHRGAGIDPADHQRIFERFERAVAATRRGGFGLGLWITSQIVEAHGGTIRVESVPGGGSTFIVELPASG